MADQNAPLETPASMGPLSPFDIEAQQAAIKRAMFAKMLEQANAPLDPGTLLNPRGVFSQMGQKAELGSVAGPGLDRATQQMMATALAQRQMMQQGQEEYGQGAQVGMQDKMDVTGMGPPTQQATLPDYAKMAGALGKMQMSGMTPAMIQNVTGPLQEQLGIQLGQHPDLLTPGATSGGGGFLPTLANNPALISAAARAGLPGTAGRIGAAQEAQIKEESKVNLMKPGESLVLGTKIITRTPDNNYNIFDVNTGTVTRAFGADAAQRAAAASEAKGKAAGEVVEVPQTVTENGQTTERKVTVPKSSLLDGPPAWQPGMPVPPPAPANYERKTTTEGVDYMAPPGGATPGAPNAATSAPVVGPLGTGSTTAQQKAVDAAAAVRQSSQTEADKVVTEKYQALASSAPTLVKSLHTAQQAVYDSIKSGDNSVGAGALNQFKRSVFGFLSGTGMLSDGDMKNLENWQTIDNNTKIAMTNKLRDLGGRISIPEMGNVMDTIGSVGMQPKVLLAALLQFEAGVQRSADAHNKLVRAQAKETNNPSYIDKWNIGLDPMVSKEDFYAKSNKR